MTGTLPLSCYVCLIVVIALMGSGCTSETHQSTSPTITIDTMLAAAEAGNWEKYVDDFYGEKHKFASPSDRDALVARFRDHWGDTVITGLKEASGIAPKLSEDGQTATFALSNGEFVLYKDDKGFWTFHL